MYKSGQKIFKDGERKEVVDPMDPGPDAVINPLELL